MPQGALDLYDAYAHGLISRRDFFSRLSRYAVGGATVASLAACVMPDYDRQQTSEADTGISAEMVPYARPMGPAR